MDLKKPRRQNREFGGHVDGQNESEGGRKLER